MIMEFWHVLPASTQIMREQGGKRLGKIKGKQRITKEIGSITKHIHRGEERKRMFELIHPVHDRASYFMSG